MKEEYLPAEYRTSPKRRSVFNAIRNSSWNFRISALLLLCALVINLTLLISIPIIGDYTFYIRSPFYNAGLEYTFSYHLHYWIMMSIFSLIGSGILIRTKSEIRKIIRYYYTIISIVIIVGLVRLLNLYFGLGFYLNPETDLVYYRIIIQMVFLTFYPTLSIIPMHLYIKHRYFSRFSVEEEILPKKQFFNMIPILIAYTLVIGLIIIIMPEFVNYRIYVAYNGIR